MQKFEGASEMISSLFLSREVHENRKENLLKIDGKNKKEKISAARFAQLISRWLSIKETVNLFFFAIFDELTSSTLFVLAGQPIKSTHMCRSLAEKLKRCG